LVYRKYTIEETKVRSESEKLLSKEAYIQKQLKSLEEERKAIKDQYISGSIPKQEYKTFLAQNDYLVAQIKERASDDPEKKRERSYERSRDMFSD
jgi:predicted  nucleic acid-binding Zn-ribbon protein